MKIVVDAMGGDYAPKVVVDGVVAAVREHNVEVILVGDEAKIKPLLIGAKYTGKNISVHHAPEVIEMHESPATSVRRKRNSSIVVGLNLVKEGKASAFFSAGNTGAVVCAATLTLGLLEDVERPGIAIVTPTLKGTSLIIDVGANIDAKPLHLLQYAIMADAYVKNIFNKTNPSVGLLNVGEEETKGTDFHKEAFELLSNSQLNFIGNVEGKALFSGKCDIIVCDGFVGNIALKVTEGTAEAIQVFLKRHLLKSNFLGKIGLLLLKQTFMNFKKELDYADYGGAPLLGVNGITIIGHGRSNLRAIKNAVRVANEEVERQVNLKIMEAVKAARVNA
ncbi:MAG: phosphate acyltransferase PlsX [Candidatus Omnitrophica bacterium]|nr:phosphate acyltransferase PlsX [Candidatus Omnitrophota bacterium]MDD5653797.1 phosphate acyltransferase PlsX [Candidatus Omnitrophota bacterium]